MPDILDDLKDLHKQATTERSHYYVAKCCQRAIAEIETLRKEAAHWKAGYFDMKGVASMAMTNGERERPHGS